MKNCYEKDEEKKWFGFVNFEKKSKKRNVMKP